MICACMSNRPRTPHASSSTIGYGLTCMGDHLKSLWATVRPTPFGPIKVRNSLVIFLHKCSDCR